MSWHAWVGGKWALLEEYRISRHDAEADARAAAVARGARLVREKMTGAYYYNDATQESFRVGREYASFALFGVREVRS